MHIILDSDLTLISYKFQLRQHLACQFYPLITIVSILTVGLSLRLLCPDLSDPSSLTKRTSDNQRLGTYTTSVAKHATLKIELD